jgi:hypothetical protein
MRVGFKDLIVSSKSLLGDFAITLALKPRDQELHAQFSAYKELGGGVQRY